MSARANTGGDTLRPHDVARLTGVSTDTLRHYETRGLLAQPRRTTAGYRRYAPEAVARVRLIQQALAAGFSLPDLARVFKEREKGGVPCRGVHQLLAERLPELDRQIADLTRLRAELADLLGDWSTRLAATPQGQRAHLLETLETRPALTTTTAASRARRFGRSR